MKSKKLFYDQKQIGARCREFRLSLGVSQSEVAAATDSKQSAVSMFESGRMASSKILLWYVMKGVKL